MTYTTVFAVLTRYIRSLTTCLRWPRLSSKPLSTASLAGLLWLLASSPSYALDCADCDCANPGETMCTIGTIPQPFYCKNECPTEPELTQSPTLYSNNVVWAPTTAQAVYGPKLIKGMADTHDHVFGEYNFGGAWFFGRANDPDLPQTLLYDDGGPWVGSFPPSSLWGFWQILDALGLDLIESGVCFALGGSLIDCLEGIAGLGDKLADLGYNDFDNGSHGVLKGPATMFSTATGGGDVGKHDTKDLPAWSGFAHQQTWEGWIREAHEKTPFLYWLELHVYQYGDTAGADHVLLGFWPTYKAAAIAFAATDPYYAPIFSPNPDSAFNTYDDNHDFQVAMFRSNYAANMKEAYNAGQVGMNLLVMSAVNQQDFCGLMNPDNFGNSTGGLYGGWDIANCRAQETMDAQIAAATDWLAGPSIAAWAKLAKTPEEARTIIETEGKLAIVFSLESSNIMDPFRSPLSVEQQIQSYVDKDVYTMQLIHQLDGRFGGAPPFNILLGTLGGLREILMDNDQGELLDAFYAQPDPVSIVTWALDQVENFAVTSSPKCVEAVDIRSGEMATFGPNDTPDFVEEGMICAADIANKGSQCEGGKCWDCTNHAGSNCITPCGVDGCSIKVAGGLTDDGKEGIATMAALGMPIDIAHMGENMIEGPDGIDQWLDDNNYCKFPVYSSHGHVREALLDAQRTEKTSSKKTLDIIAKRGGVFGVRTGPETTIATRYTYTSATDVAGSSQSFAQSLIKTWDHKVNTAFGLDMNGFAQQPKPRSYLQHFEVINEEDVPDATSYTPYQYSPPTGALNLTGPFWVLRLDESGSSTGSYNIVWKYDMQFIPSTALGTELDWRGLAHIGLLPDFMWDLVKLDTDAFKDQPLNSDGSGVVQPQTTNLMYGAGSYIAMWERATKLKNAPAWRSHGWSCDDIENLMWTPSGEFQLSHIKKGGPVHAPSPVVAQPDMGPMITLGNMTDFGSSLSETYMYQAAVGTEKTGVHGKKGSPANKGSQGKQVTIQMPLHGVIGRYLAITPGQRDDLKGGSPWANLGPTGTLVIGPTTLVSEPCESGSSHKITGGQHGRADKKIQKPPKNCVVTKPGVWTSVPTYHLDDEVIPEGGQPFGEDTVAGRGALPVPTPIPNPLPSALPGIHP